MNRSLKPGKEKGAYVPSNLSSCNSVSYNHRLILLPSQGFTHTDCFLFFLFFVRSSKATIAESVSSLLSIFKWNLLDLFEHLYRFHWIFFLNNKNYKIKTKLKNDKKWSCKLLSFDLNKKRNSSFKKWQEMIMYCKH